MRYFFWLAALLLCISCSPLDRTIESLPDINFDDPEVVRILNLQDRRLTDSLLIYFQSAQPNHRYLAARAFASVQDKKAIPGLLQLLKENNQQIKAISAFALGQIGDESAESGLTEAFEKIDSIESVMLVNKEILEALGKCGSDESLKFIASARNYGPEDIPLVQGQAKSLYRFGLRGKTDSLGTERMVDILYSSAYDYTSRLFATNYLYRFRDLDLSLHVGDLIKTYLNEEDKQIKLFLAVVLGRLNRDSALNQLLGDLQSSNDPALKCNIIRGLNGYPYERVKNSVLPLLYDDSPTVVRTVVDYLIEKGEPYDAAYYWNIARADTTKILTRSLLYIAANKHMPATSSISKGRINQEIIRALDANTDPYIKANYLKALGEFGWNYQILGQKTFEAQHPVVKMTGLQAIASIYRRADTNPAFNTGRRTVKRNIAAIMATALKSNDIGMIRSVSGMLSNENSDIISVFKDTTAIQTALASLNLSRDYNAYTNLAAALDSLGARTDITPPLKPGFNHPIEFNKLRALSDSSTAVIQTNRGNIVVELFRKEAPGSVVNFVDLSTSAFYDGKIFHRVVPNFVIQTGSDRGDGQGMNDYSIRSEFSQLSFDEGGYVGMASAGKDTEGKQFFITHTAALHLDGRYTIFGKVIQGMEVVNAIDIGDQIVDVNIIF